jgi:phosphoglycolate phosphatase-like HAD superfamily hydrolase
VPRTDLRGGAEAIVISALSALSAIVFDFDGTIVESVATKTEAFRTLFENYPEHVDSIVALHTNEGGRSRYQKFALIYRDILRREPTAGEFAALGDRFARLVYEAVVACPYVPGALEFIREWSWRIPLVVVSGTPHDELVRVIERRGLASYFAEVHGSPSEKEDIVRELVARQQWRPDRVLLVGDALTDSRAAEIAGVRFLGRVQPGGPNPFPAGVPTIPDLCRFVDIVGKLFDSVNHAQGTS